jgi:outer membrane protein OmpA-like peptidoglycan-associated protein
LKKYLGCKNKKFSGRFKMKAITVKRVLMFIVAVFSMFLMVGCAHMMDKDGCPLRGGCSSKGGCPEKYVAAPEPEQVMVAAAEQKIIVIAFEDIHFDFDKSTLKPEARTILKRNIKILNDNPNAKVRIAGYTSASGSEEYNQKLSERRAKAVEEYLISEGIAKERLTMIGYGESDPAMHEADPTDLYSTAAKANMRVLFEIVVQ